MRRVRGACILREGLNLPASAQDLADLGFNLRTAVTLEPDILITVAGKPHAFLLFDELRGDAGAGREVNERLSTRLSKLQQTFPTVYALMPGSYGQSAAAAFAARHTDVCVVTYYDTQDAVATAVRLVQEVSKSPEEGGLSFADIHTQRLALATDSAAIDNTLRALAATTMVSMVSEDYLQEHLTPATGLSR